MKSTFEILRMMSLLGLVFGFSSAALGGSVTPAEIVKQYGSKNPKDGDIAIPKGNTSSNGTYNTAITTPMDNEARRGDYATTTSTSGVSNSGGDYASQIANMTSSFGSSSPTNNAANSAATGSQFTNSSNPNSIFNSQNNPPAPGQAMPSGDGTATGQTTQPMSVEEQQAAAWNSLSDAQKGMMTAAVAAEMWCQENPGFAGGNNQLCVAERTDEIAQANNVYTGPSQNSGGVDPSVLMQVMGGDDDKGGDAGGGNIPKPTPQELATIGQ